MLRTLWELLERSWQARKSERQEGESLKVPLGRQCQRHLRRTLIKLIRVFFAAFDTSASWKEPLARLVSTKTDNGKENKAGVFLSAVTKKSEGKSASISTRVDPRRLLIFNEGVGGCGGDGKYNYGDNERTMGDLGCGYIRRVRWKESLEYCCSMLLAPVKTTAGGALVDETISGRQWRRVWLGANGGHPNPQAASSARQEENKVWTQNKPGQKAKQSEPMQVTSPLCPLNWESRSAAMDESSSCFFLQLLARLHRRLEATWHRCQHQRRKTRKTIEVEYCSDTLPASEIMCV